MVGGAELVSRKDDVGWGDLLQLPLVVLAVGRVADHHEGERRRNPGIGSDQMVQAVFGDEPADGEEVATRLEPEGLQRLRPQC